MRFTDLFVRRPVLATVVSLVILLLGLRAASDLNVRQYPELQNAVVNVTTTYIGADADLVQGFITTPLEREIASAEGIDYLVSNSSQSVSTIQAYIRLDRDPNQALTQIAAKVNAVRNALPAESEDPVVALASGEGTAAMYVSFSSSILDNNQITDYLIRVVEPLLATLPGVQKAEIIGARTFAMRIWLKPERLAAYNVTGSDVVRALQANNYLAAVGETKGSFVKVNLRADTDLKSVEEFKQLAIRAEGDSVVRIGDIADVVLGAESYDTEVRFNGKNAIFMGIQVAPDANTLDVVQQVRDAWPGIVGQLPEGLQGEIAYDATRYIRDSIKEVIKTLVEAVVIVIVVIYLFLGSFRSVLIPAVTVPLSIIGAFFIMLALGFTINLLTLLAMVLAIGMVVDDAIIVLENIHRHIEDGMKPFDAALQGARELANPVIAMTITLVAVYAPIGFIGGLTGKLFIEFAFTLAGAVLLSGIIALTLTPMMCSKLLKPLHNGAGEGRFAAFLDRQFGRLRHAYQRRLHGALEDKAAILIFGAMVLVSCYFLFVTSPSELAPEEDQGFALIFSETDAYASIDYLAQYTAEIAKVAQGTPEIEYYFLLNGLGGSGPATNAALSGTVMRPWGERTRTTKQIVEETLQPKLNDIAALQNAVFQPPPLPTGGFGLPVEFVVASTQPARVLNEFVNDIVGNALNSKKFIFLNSNLKIDRPQVTFQIDRDKAALLGIDMRSLGNDMAALLSGGFTNRFSLENRSYKVIPQVERGERLFPEQLAQYYTRTGRGELVPLSTLVSLRESVQPQQLNRFQQLNAATIQGIPRPGVPLGEALGVLEDAAKKILPPGYTVDYSGQSRQYKIEGSALVATFFFALIIIYLVLAAQFESFRDPIIMLVTVPMSICGAMLFVSLGFTTLNIYTQVGLVTLIGVISKHGILIVEFANQLQKQGRDQRAAIEEAAAIRLRPVLMTTASLVLAMIPLLIAQGPGASARFSMGLVIATGMSIGTLFTLFVVPAMYLYLGHKHAIAEKQSGRAIVTPGIS